jgi:transcription termination factor NusB
MEYKNSIATAQKTSATMSECAKTLIFNKKSGISLGISSKKQCLEFQISKTSSEIILNMDWIEQNILNLSFSEYLVTLKK